MERDTSTQLISSGVKSFLRRRFEEMIGLGLVLLSLVMLAILITSDRGDATSQTVNSLNGQISNILGGVGAEVAAVVHTPELTPRRLVGVNDRI